MRPLLATLATLALAQASAAGSALQASTDAEPIRWQDLELPAHFNLELEDGVVTSRGAEGRPVLAYASGWLHSEVPLRALAWSDDGARRHISRDGGESVSGVEAEVGRELVFDLYGEAWGYLRVVEVRPEGVRLEYALESRSEPRELSRDPSELHATSGAEGVALGWSPAEGATYRVERRPLHTTLGRPTAGWEEVARVEGGTWFDASDEESTLSEYRVTRVGHGFGARARGVGALAPASELLRARAGQAIDLLSGRVDGPRIDLEVEFVRKTGAQLQPCDSCAARILTPAEVAGWDLPELFEAGPRAQRYFVAPGRVLAMRLAEGVLARVRVVSIEGEEVTLERLVNLDGSRTFPPPPRVVEARWDPSLGVALSFEPPPARPESERSGILLEREEPDGTWRECRRGERGELVLVDSTPTAELLARYRARRWLGESAHSPYGEVVSVLIGDDGGAGSEELLERAMADLGASDFGRRGRAREALVVLGERAWPRLREALRSQDPELAEAARELLLAGAQDEAAPAKGQAEGDLTGLLLGVRAEELSAGAPPHPDWTSADPGARASAALRGLGWREVSAQRTARWRRVLAEADPDGRVRLAANLAAALQREGLGPDLRQGSGLRGGASGGLDAPLFPHPSLDTGAAERDPWSSLALLRAWHDLARATGAGSEVHELALERYELVRALVSQYERGGDELFLESALRVTRDAVACLEGALDHFARRPRRDWRDARVVRLEEPDAARLVAELEELKLDPEEALDIILPAGVYGPLPGGRQIVAERGRVRLRAEGTVELRSGFTLMNGCEALFEGLSIAPMSGIALNLVASEARLEDCHLEAQSVGVMGSDSSLELLRCAVLRAEGASGDGSGVRLSGRSLLFASESRIEGRSIGVYGPRFALFDASVVFAEQRTAVEGSGEGQVYAMGSLFAGGHLALARYAGGVLDGVGLVGGANPLLQAGPELRICADHVWCEGDALDPDDERWLERCALRR